MAKLSPQTIAKAMKTASASGRRIELADPDVAGLMLRIAAESPEPKDGETREHAERRRGAWSVRVVQADCKRVRVPLGSYAEVEIAAAREAARLAKAKALAGEVVSAAERREAAREAERLKVTLRRHLAAYDRQKLAQLRSGALQRRAIELLLGDALDDVPERLTRARFARCVDERVAVAAVAANRGLAYAKPFLKWVSRRVDNFVSPATDFDKPTKERPRERTLGMSEVVEIWRAAEGLGYPMGDFVRVLLLTGGRRDEVAEMQVNEIDLDAGIWTLPAHRSKNGRAHRIPLAAPVVEIIREAISGRPGDAKDCEFVFTTNGRTPMSGWSQLKAKLAAAIATARGEGAPAMAPWVLHDFRRAFATAAVDALRLDPGTVDRCLNHVGAGTSSTVSRVYQRSEMLDQRRAALTAWANFVLASVNGARSGNVIEIGARRV